MLKHPPDLLDRWWRKGAVKPSKKRRRRIKERARKQIANTYMTRLKLLCSGAISTCTWGSLFGSRRRWPQEKNYTYAWLLDLETAAILMRDHQNEVYIPP
jgi:hypothetical protein